LFQIYIEEKMLVLVTYQNRICLAHKQTVMPHTNLSCCLLRSANQNQKGRWLVYIHISFSLSPSLFLVLSRFFFYSLLFSPTHNAKDNIHCALTGLYLMRIIRQTGSWAFLPSIYNTIYLVV
jgi:hypothetical protein